MTGRPLLVGGVAELWQGDLDLGRRAVERLAAEDLGPGVVVEELSYGAVAVAQRLEDLRPRALVLVGATRRGRRAGTVDVVPAAVGTGLPPEAAQAAVADAVTGYVALDLVVEVAAALGALPADITLVDVEPASVEPSEHLTPAAEAALERALAAVREAVSARRGPRDPGAAPPRPARPSG